MVGLISSATAGLERPAFALVLSGMLTALGQRSPDKVRSDGSFYSWMFLVLAVGTFASILVQQVGAAVSAYASIATHLPALQRISQSESSSAGGTAGRSSAASSCLARQC